MAGALMHGYNVWTEIRRELELVLERRALTSPAATAIASLVMYDGPVIESGARGPSRLGAGHFLDDLVLAGGVFVGDLCAHDGLRWWEELPAVSDGSSWVEDCLLQAGREAWRCLARRWVASGGRGYQWRGEGRFWRSVRRMFYTSVEGKQNGGLSAL